MPGFVDGITEYLTRLVDYNWPVTIAQLLMIAVVVWLVLRFLRGTRGARLFKGAVILLAGTFFLIQLLPSQEDWQRIEFLFAKFMWFGAFAFIVAFQPELRRVFVSLGQAWIFRGRHDDVIEMADELTKSINYLSKNKIGAIIAIERSVGLAGIVRTGTNVDAEITAELINTIFYPGSSLHDMGVILRQDRIVAAGCQFPMAESEEVDSSLGSRHRAALGMAKDSDAVVLVVSEETGRVALANDGQLQVGLDIENIHEILLSMFKVPRNVSKPSVAGAS